MQFKQFLSQLNKATSGNVVEEVGCYGHLIQETDGGSVFIDRVPSTFTSLDEAKEYIKQQKIREELQEEIQQEQYTEISSNKIANIINQHHADVKVTDTLVESYVELASSKIFTVDPIVNDIRSITRTDRLIETHVDFKLDDGTVIVISEAVQDKLNNIFAGHLDAVEHMRSSKEAFLSVLDQLEE
jgi:hypothetical protein